MNTLVISLLYSFSFVLMIIVVFLLLVTICNRGDKLCLYGLPVITASLQGGSGTTLCSCKFAEDVQFPAC